MVRRLKRCSASILLALSLGGFCLATHSFSEEVSQASLHEDMKSIIDRGELVVALVDEQNPPWFFKNKEGILEGSEIELARAMAKELGVRVRFNQKRRILR